MNNSLGIISAFLGGAIVGAGAALLFAPEKGADLRKRYATCSVSAASSAQKAMLTLL